MDDPIRARYEANRAARRERNTRKARPQFQAEKAQMSVPLKQFSQTGSKESRQESGLSLNTCNESDGEGHTYMSLPEHIIIDAREAASPIVMADQASRQIEEWRDFVAHSAIWPDTFYSRYARGQQFQHALDSSGDIPEKMSKDEIGVALEAFQGVKIWVDGMLSILQDANNFYATDTLEELLKKDRKEE